MAAKDMPLVIDLLEEEEEEWPEAGAQNPEEAEQYMDRINNVFDHLSTLIHEDTKDALGQTIKNFKKLVAKQWETMGDVDIDIILHTIKDPTAVYLRQHLTRGGVKVFDPPEEIPTSPEFIHQLPERTRHAEETAFIADIFEHAAQAHEHLLAVCVNISVLAKITDKTTLHTVINGAIIPLVQINIPKGFLNLVKDRQAKTTEEQRCEKVRKTVLPVSNAPCLAHEPKNGPTCILAAAVWLKLNHKYFNEGMAKKACERFEVRAKQLSRVLMGRKYLGGTQARKHKATEELPAQRKKADT